MDLRYFKWSWAPDYGLLFWEVPYRDGMPWHMFMVRDRWGFEYEDAPGYEKGWVSYDPATNSAVIEWWGDHASAEALDAAGNEVERYFPGAQVTTQRFRAALASNWRLADEVCPACKGSGEECTLCQGTGTPKTDTERRYEVGEDGQIQPKKASRFREITEREKVGYCPGCDERRTLYRLKDADLPLDPVEIGARCRDCLTSIMQARDAFEVPEQKTAGWTDSWLDYADEIAEAYEQMPVYDPTAAPAWQALAQESLTLAERVRQRVQVEIVTDPEPYTNAQAMCQDVYENRHLYVSTANAAHPVFTPEEYVAFRVVHDVLGHCAAGGSYSWVGESLACSAHFALLSPLAREALFTEALGQAAYRKRYGREPVAKIGLLSAYLQPQPELPSAIPLPPAMQVAPPPEPSLPDPSLPGTFATSEGGVPSWSKDVAPALATHYLARFLTSVSRPLAADDPRPARRQRLPERVGEPERFRRWTERLR